MKGTSFQKPLELGVKVEGESWSQGEPIRGTLTARNHGTEAFSVSGLQLHLALGHIKKVHQKSEGAFEILATAKLQGPETIGPGQDASFEWSFPTDRKFPITDTVESPFLLFGHGPALEKLGALQLNVKPDPVIRDILALFSVPFRFVLKSTKNSKRGIDAKFAPPDGKTFSAVDTLTVSFSFDGDTVELRYALTVKKLEATAAAQVETAKAKREARQSFTAAEYKTASGRLDHERVEAGIREILSQFESKVLY